MASQKYVSKFYKNGTTAKGVLTVPGVTLKPEAKKIVREEWEKMKDLHEKQLIDEDVYNLWKEKILKEYKKNIDL